MVDLLNIGQVQSFIHNDALSLINKSGAEINSAISDKSSKDFTIFQNRNWKKAILFEASRAVSSIRQSRDFNQLKNRYKHDIERFTYVFVNFIQTYNRAVSNDPSKFMSPCLNQ